MSAELSVEVQLLDELIPDHARAAKEKDLFDHDDYVDRLVQVIDHVDVGRTSANVALYGSWGSGKSGIGNALKDRLIDRDDVEYADFEAFKFGRDPLLRNFVSRLSEQLFRDDETRIRTYRRRLYESTSRPFVDFDQARELHPNLVWPLVFGLALLSGFALGLWLDPRSEYQKEAGNYFKLVGFLVFGVFLTYFTLSRTRSPASGDEEFEAIFKDILERAEIGGNGRRLVVFIDELDRCAPSEVAATLESIRTFLGVPGCIFIVAADQQVLEHALTEQLRQSTPPDITNPYYSAGSAYLDKIFQYQVSFPPLRTRRLTGFALELVEHRAGVWADPLIDKEDVVSVLLPTHIHSPRRVKVLLNAFALTYGIAAARADVDREKLPKMAIRAAELAKLVCIKLEFPLFARDLALDDRLVAAVLTATEALDGDDEAKNSLEQLPEDLCSRAIQYARGELPVAQLLSTDEFDVGAKSKDDDQDNGEPDAVDDLSESDEDVDKRTVRVRHATQLIRYLEKTDRIPGPRSDLIHLESAGARWGLDPQEAELLERDARDNRTRAVVQRVLELAPDDRSRALQMLGQLSRELFAQADDDRERDRWRHLASRLRRAADREQEMVGGQTQ